MIATTLIVNNLESKLQDLKVSEIVLNSKFNIFLLEFIDRYVSLSSLVYPIRSGDLSYCKLTDSSTDYDRESYLSNINDIAFYCGVFHGNNFKKDVVKYVLKDVVLVDTFKAYFKLTKKLI